MKRITILLLIFSIPLRTGASPVFSSLLPNPLGDDTLGEYIEIRNTGCSPIDIGGYEVRDLQKGYTFPTPTLIASKTNLRLTYAVSKISLNNSGLETIVLKNSSGSVIDSYSYSGTQRDDIVLNITTIDEVCESPLPTEPIEEVLSDSGVIQTGESIPAVSSGALTLENTGGTLSGEVLISTGSEVASGSIVPEPENSQTGIVSPDSPGLYTGSIESSTGIVEEGDSLTGILLGSSGSIMFGSGEVLASGAIIESPSVPSVPITGGNGESVGIGYSETGLLVPQEMYYSDEDANNRIDTLEIVYPYVLTGVVHTGAISLYSRSGGISQTRINTETGYILGGMLSGNTLILSLREGDIEKLELHITDTTTSDLRLKSTGDLGFRSLGGQAPEAFFLTTSFDSYRNVIYKEYLYEIVDEGGEEGVIGDTEEEVPEIVFPDILPTLQSPTNATFSSGGFECSVSPCRINITLEPIFSSGYSIKEYSCYFGTGDILTIDVDCNPGTYYFTASGQLDIELVSKLDPTAPVKQSFPIIWSISALPIASKISDEPDKNPPVIILEHDGKWRSYYTQISDYELECYAFTCAINMTAENSYDPEGSAVRYMWMYDMRHLSEKKDPGEYKFGPGDHVIWLRVIDASENMSEVYFRISVRPEGEKVTKGIPEKKSKSQKNAKTSSTSGTKMTKKSRIKKFSFFDPPQIVLQSKDSSLKKYHGYRCITTQKNCSFNFTLSGTQKGILYTWKYSDGTEMTSKNPRSRTLNPGIHTVVLTASYDGKTPLWTEKLDLKVDKIKKTKKKKAKAIKNPKLPKVPKKQADTPALYTPLEIPKQDTSLPTESLFLFGGLGIMYLFRRRIFV